MRVHFFFVFVLVAIGFRDRRSARDPGQWDERIGWGGNRFFRRPDRAERLFPETFPTLKRWANEHCAYGARQSGTTLLRKWNQSAAQLDAGWFTK